MARAWVIGGLQGIGEAITQELRLQNLEVTATGEDVDVRSTRQLHDTYYSLQPKFVVYCAGVNDLMPADELDEFSALNIMDINVLGFMRMIRLIALNTGVTHSVVAISSDAATRPMRNSMAYCSSKAALSMAVRCAARELAPVVQVNAVAPGVVADTPHTSAVDKQVEAIKGWPEGGAQAADEASIPMGRRATKLEIASIVYSVLVAPKYLTGEVIIVNGGK